MFANTRPLVLRLASPILISLSALAAPAMAQQQITVGGTIYTITLHVETSFSGPNGPPVDLTNATFAPWYSDTTGATAQLFAQTYKDTFGTDFGISASPSNAVVFGYDNGTDPTRVGIWRAWEDQASLENKDPGHIRTNTLQTGEAHASVSSAVQVPEIDGGTLSQALTVFGVGYLFLRGRRRSVRTSAQPKLAPACLRHDIS